MAEELFTTPSNLSIGSVIVDTSGALDGQSLVYDGAKFAPADIVPIGTVEMWVNSTPPSGWLMCGGQNVSRTTYSRLFSILGTTFGAGDGSTTFRLPNFEATVPSGIAGGTAPASGSLTSNAANFDHSHTIDSSFESGDQSAARSHKHDTTTGGSHTHGLVASNNSHTHSSNGPNANHTHQQLYNTASFINGTTGASRHNTGHNGINSSNANVGDHTHNLDITSLSAHGHSLDDAGVSHTHTTWNGSGVESNSGTSSHSHTVNTQRIYFIIKH